MLIFCLRFITALHNVFEFLNVKIYFLPIPSRKYRYYGCEYGREIAQQYNANQPTRL